MPPLVAIERRPEKDKKADNGKSWPFGRYLESIGGSLTVAGFISTFPTKLYWVGVGMFLGGMLCLALGAIWEDWKIRWRLLACVFWTALTVKVALGVVFVPAPLNITAGSYSGDYADKSNVYGIMWEKGMSELRVTLINSTDNNYDNLDFSFTPDVETRTATQVTSVPNVHFMLGEDAREIVTDTHLIINGVEQPVPAYSSKNGIRMLCPTLPKNSRLEILIALVDPVKLPGSDSPGKVTAVLRSGDVEDYAGPKQMATQVSIVGDYSVMNRPHAINATLHTKQP